MLALIERLRRMNPPRLDSEALILAVFVSAALLVAAAIPNADALIGEYGFYGDFDSEYIPYFVVGALLVLAIAFAILLNWRLGVMLLAASLPFQEKLAAGPIASVPKMLALLTLFSVGLKVLHDREFLTKLWRLVHQPLFICLIILVLWSMSSLLWADYRMTAVIKTSTFGGLAAFALIVGLLEKNWLYTLWIILAFSAFLSVPLGFILPGPAGFEEEGRFTSGGLHPNDYGGLLVCVFFVAYFILSEKLRAAKYIIVPTLFAVFFYGVFASQSRAALLAFLMAPLLLLIVPAVRVRSLRFVILIFSLAIVMLMSILYVDPSVGEKIVTRYQALSEFQSAETWSGRWSIWGGAVRVIASDPLIGVGAGNFPSAVYEYSFQAGIMEASRQGSATAHNTFLAMAAELGVIGLALFLGVLIFAGRRAKVLASRNSTVGIGLLYAFTAYVIMGLATTWETQKIAYIIYGSILSVTLAAQTTEYKREDQAPDGKSSADTS